MKSFCRIEGPSWSDRPVFIVGGGSSLTPHVDKLVSLHEKGHVVAINDSFRFCSPDIVLSIDLTWLDKRKGEIPSLKAPVIFAAEFDSEMIDVPNITYIRKRPRAKIAKLSIDSDYIINGLNSGHAGVSYAFLRKAKEIFLLGFDFYLASDGKTHFHEGYKWGSPRNSQRLYPAWVKIFDDCADQLKGYGVKVWNCNPKSCLRSFPFKPYEDVLGTGVSGGHN